MVNETSVVLLSFFTGIWWITVDMLLLVIGVVESYFLGLKYLIPLKKVNLLHLNYPTVLIIVEFALPPQHETSSDSEIHLISDINDLAINSRKRPISALLLSIHSSD